jgi:hypothetical protein
MMSFGIVGLGLMLLGLAGYLATDPSKIWWKRAIGFLAVAPFGIAVLGFGVLRVWLEGGAQPEPRAMTIAPGVRYARHIRQSPNPLVWHVARVDLTAPGTNVLVTPGDGTRVLPLVAKTTSDVAREFHADLAISGDLFEPARTHSVFEPPPFPGQALRPLGMASSKGVLYTKSTLAADRVSPTLYFTDANAANIGTPSGNPHNAISGDCVLITSGKASDFSNCTEPLALLPRAVIGLDQSRHILVMMVVDGYRTARSPGATLAETVSLLLEEGVDTAIQLGSGSMATMVGRGADGKPALLSEPVTGGIPGVETPIANHLMIVSEQKAF